MRLTLMVTVLFGLAFGAVTYLMVSRIEAALVADIQNRNEGIAQSIIDLVAAGRIHRGDDITVTEGLLFQLEGLQQAGTVEASIDWPDGFHQQLSTAFRRDRVVASNDFVSRFRVQEINGNPLAGPLVVTVKSPREAALVMMGRVRGPLVVGTAATVLAAGVGAWLLVGRALKPVSDITRQAREISLTTLDRRVPEPSTDDEIGQLARTVNAMLDRLQAASERQTRFVSDASHEFRSPVSSIRVQLETALLHPEAADWPRVAHAVLTEYQRLANLVDNLLALARLEEGQARVLSEVDLDELVYVQLQRPRRVALDRSGVVAGRVMGSADELTSVVRNLLDNAERHAATKMAAKLVTRGPWVRFSVADDGPGIPVDLRLRIFERFSRLQEARNRDAGGSGLGLALTKRIVESHGGRIWVQDSPLGGAEFVVELPSAEPESEPEDVPTAPVADPNDESTPPVSSPF
ncbi:MAG: HAMP domain-containing sensor histidine kinase [Microthrixaceae bacterium]